MGVEKYKRGFQVAQHNAVLEQPLRWRKPRLVFVNSMSDLFHEAVDFDFIQAVFRVMNRSPQHTFQVLTKRPDRALALGPETALDTQHLARCEHRVGALAESPEDASADRRADEVSFPRTAPRPPVRSGSLGRRLGDRWRGVGSRRATGRSELGSRDTRLLRREPGPVFLQAVGWRQQEADRSVARRQDLGPNAGAQAAHGSLTRSVESCPAIVCQPSRLLKMTNAGLGPRISQSPLSFEPGVPGRPTAPTMAFTLWIWRIYIRIGREFRHCEASGCLGGLLGLGGPVGGPPFAGGLARLARIGAAGTLALAALRDAGEHAPDGLAQRGRVLQ